MVRPSASLHPAVGARPLIESATVLLLRDGQQGLEVLISLRAAASSFVPGMYVFPGGRVDADDAAWLDVWQPLFPAAWPRRTRLQALAAVRAGGVHALAHITGGGLTENPPRVIPEGLACEIDLSAWELPPVFRWLATTANMSQPELLKTFNCGIGMIAVVAADRAHALADLLRAEGETVVELGRVVAGEGVIYKGKLL